MGIQLESLTEFLLDQTIKLRRFGVTFFLSILTFGVVYSQAQEPADTDESASEVEEEQEAEEEVDYDDVVEVVATGTRLSSPDLSRRVEVMSAEEIAARGLSTAEDIIRAIPQNFSSINSATNLNFGSEAIDINLGALNIGTSTANLNGFGSSNTLVLIDGKRMAGKAGEQNFFVNLRDIPAGSIERVEIVLDGGSTIYGSDAVGGVINVITKKNYQGYSVSTRHEISSTSSDQSSVSLVGGYSWDDGRLAFTVSGQRSNPVNTQEAGYVTRDYSPFFGGNQEYNFNSEYNLKSAAVSTSRWGPFLTINEDNDGRNVSASDYRAPTQADWATDVERQSTGATDDLGVTLEVNQEVGDNLRLSGRLAYNNSYTSRKVTRFGQSSIVVPASNAFNPFGRTVYVQYNPRTEIDLGMVPLPNQESESDAFALVLEGIYEINSKWHINASINHSATEAMTSQWMFGTQQDRDHGDDALQARIDELLASSDPAVAINLFGNGTGQNPTVAELVVPIAVSKETTEVRSFEAYAEGALMEMRGDTLELVVGMESREQAIKDKSSYRPIGVDRPSRDLTAVFAELRVPLVGNDDNIPLIQTLQLSFSARYDKYSTEGANGSDDNDNPIIVDASFDNVSPRIGVAWIVNEDFNVRASLSESFRAPTFGDLFGTFRLDIAGAFDPLCECYIPSARLNYGPNPGLKPEYADNINVGAIWSPSDLNGFTLKVDYAQKDFQDRIASMYELGDLLPLDVWANMPLFFERGPDGTLLRINNSSVNIARRLSDTVDVDVRKVFNSDFGTVEFGANLHYVIDLYDQALTDATKARFVGEIVGIDRYDAIANVSIFRNNLSVDVFANYTPEYTNNDFDRPYSRDIPNTTVPGRLTFDASVQYQFQNGLRLRAGGRNITNKSFPFTITRSGTPYDATRVNLRGRILYLDLTYEWGG